MIINDMWLHDNTPYSPSDCIKVFEKISEICKYVGSGKTKYLNIPISFDTETTSFYNDRGEKTAIVYVWCIGICGLVIMGRTWDEYIYVYNCMVRFFRTSGKRIAIIYIHNLAFDFQFLRKHHTFNKVFATDNYQPLYAITNEGIEFRCSYRLSGYNLDTLAKNLIYHKIKKLKGDLDYRQLRHSKTKLSNDEILYCLNDVKIVNCYIDELIQREDNISNIPLTKTGFVRRDCRNECFLSKNYKYIIQSMELTPDEFNLCKAAFQGGYTHANADIVGKKLDNVTSLDIISSYPSVMINEQYPMGKPKHVEIKSVSQLREYCQLYCCVFTIILKNIHPKFWYDFYISSSKCKIYGKRILSNGRVVSADAIETTITNVDFEIIDYMYDFDMNNIIISDFIIFKREYLPTPFVKYILKLYHQKTILKGVEGKEAEYQVTKENVNSAYGMTVTSPIRDIIKYNGEWLEPEIPELIDAINRYNNNYNRFLYYPWGIFVTAYARRNIWSAIKECGYDHCYTDTDSEKCINFDKHNAFFDKYNQFVLEKHKKALMVHGIDINMVMPKTQTGKIKLLGAFDNEGTYTHFKTCGAKRYLYEIDGHFNITVAGLNKKSGLEYLLNKYGNDGIWDAFQDGLSIPAEFSGRLTHTYIDEMRTGKLIDLYGVESDYKELSSVHLEPTTYNMGITSEFLKFINDIREGVFEWQ